LIVLRFLENETALPFLRGARGDQTPIALHPTSQPTIFPLFLRGVRGDQTPIALLWQKPIKILLSVISFRASPVMNQQSESIEQIRRQFDFGPYPQTPLEKSPKDDENFNRLFIHSLITPYYLQHQQVINTEGKVILDAGCGSGYKALALAEANPGAKIVGVDLSSKSVELAKKRLTYHGFDNTEFYTLAIEELPQLGLKFDYINCDEVLYLTDDPVIALKAMQSTLTEEGMIRTNLHSIHNRAGIYRMQEVFKLMGLMDENPEEMEIEAAVETVKALKNDVRTKAQTWNPKQYEGESQKEVILMNYLFHRDKGYTIPQLFDFLEQSQLNFISMVDWRRWELLDLFQDPENLPFFIEMGLSDISIQQRLHLFELLHPANRLLDCWCSRASTNLAAQPLNQWEKPDWEQAVVHLHPQLATEKVRNDLIECINEQRFFEISKFIPLPTTKKILIESEVAATLLPLFDEPAPFPQLVERWLKIQPVDPITLESKAWDAAFTEIQKQVENLEAFLYLLVEKK